MGIMLHLEAVFFLAIGCLGYVPKDTLPACIRDSKNGVCGRRGAATAANLYQYEVFNDPALTEVPNLDACRIACMQFQYDEGYQRTCRSLAWNSGNKTCTLYEERAGTIGFKARATSPLEFYNYACFDCLSTCPTAGGNILTNPDFDRPTAAANYLEGTEATLKPWNEDLHEGYPDRDLLVTSNGFGSPNSLRITPFATLKQTFHACLGQTYEISFDYKMESISSQDALYFIEIGNSGYQPYYRFQSPLYVADKDRWFHFVETFIPTNLSTSFMNSKPDPLTSFIRLDYQGDSYNAYFIDNIVVRPVNPASYAAVPGSKNLLINGGFESGRLGAWRKSFSNPISIRSPGFNSKYAAGQPAGNQNNPQTELRISQSFTAEIGKLYLLSFRYKRTARCDASQHVSLYFQDQTPASRGGKETYGSVSYEVFFEGAPDQWITHQRPFMATSSKMSITLWTSSGACDPLIDDITLKPMA